MIQIVLTRMSIKNIVSVFLVVSLMMLVPGYVFSDQTKGTSHVKADESVKLQEEVKSEEVIKAKEVTKLTPENSAYSEQAAPAEKSLYKEDKEEIKPQPVVKKIPNSLIYMDTGDEKIEYVLLVEKRTQTLFLYSFDNRDFKEIVRFRCSTGKKAGDKTRKGDQRTPEGVYFFKKIHEKKYLSAIYGIRAFTTDYPNIIDRLAEKTGSSIWLHGTNKKLKAMDSNGCVAMEDSDLDGLSSYITLDRTPIIVVDEIEYSPYNFQAKKEIFDVFTELNHAFQSGSYHDWLDLFHPDYLPDISWWPEWNKMRKKLAESGNLLEFEFKPVVLARTGDTYVALAGQIAGNNEIKENAGVKKFFLKKNSGRFKIVGDEYQVFPKNIASKKNKEPLLAVLSNLSRKLPMPEEKIPAVEERVISEQAISKMIEDWAKAWSAKDIDKYESFYAKNFRSSKKNLKKWIKHKRRLNKKYKFINVTIDGFKIEKARKNDMIVSFVQNYRSSGYNAKGRKELILKPENGQWKIYRENWKRK